MDLQSDLAGHNHEAKGFGSDCYITSGESQRSELSEAVRVMMHHMLMIRASRSFDLHFGNVQQAVDIARRAFPTLRDVSEDKIDFAISPRKDMYGGPLISILDDAWAGMATWPPETLLVSVKESPDDKARRERRTDPKNGEERELTLIRLSSRAQA
jgi:hypothetical protein